MKKIVFVSKSMDFGGVERSLISLLKRIPENKYDITVLLMQKKGGMLKDIPKWINIEEIPNISKPTKYKLIELIKKFRFLAAIKLIYNLILSIKSKSIYVSYEKYAKILPDLQGEFDVAISYFNPTAFPVVYTMNNIKSKKKIMWIHSDVDTYKDIYEYEDIYSKYDLIYNASKEGTSRFKNKFPNLSDKTETFYNLIDKKELDYLGVNGESFDDAFNGIRILTVGRLGIEKGQNFIPKILNRLLQLGKNVKWYCIGDVDL